jgi:hypothetical protein
MGMAAPMSTPTPDGRRDTDRIVTMPPTNKGLLAAAGICLLIPLVALLWVSSYSKATPRLGGIPFFFWYQFLWVFLTSALTYTAHRLVLAARRHGDGTRDVRGWDDNPDDSPTNLPSGDDTLNPAPGFRS